MKMTMPYRAALDIGRQPINAVSSEAQLEAQPALVSETRQRSGGPGISHLHRLTRPWRAHGRLGSLSTHGVRS
jgi:hypothetical protein